MISIEIDQARKRRWQQAGYLLVERALAPAQVATLSRWLDELVAWPEQPGKWMKWYERAGGRRQLCRIEDFLPYHGGLAAMLEGIAIQFALQVLLDEPAVLFKEKINFKLPGGSGFKPHQDAPAFTTFGQSYHVTVMLSVDASTLDNGCLEVVEGLHGAGVLAQDGDGTLDPVWSEQQNWTPIETRPGDLLFFDSFVPHRSGDNRSDRARRALYVTYNRAREGSVRDQYLQRKRAAFPPECERISGVDYGASASTYNLGNPIL